MFLASTLRRGIVASRLAAAAGVALVLVLSQGAVGLASPPTIRAVSGRFTTVIPRGFRNDTAAFSDSPLKIELVMLGSKVDGFTVNINVLTEHAPTGDVGALAQAALGAVKRTTSVHRVSAFRDLTIDGSDARAVDYLVSVSGRTLHDQQVYVIHNGWAYAITYTALAGSEYRGSLSALSQALANWRWH
jgi:hypothetical protein